MKNDIDEDDDVSPQDMEQQLLLELRDPVGAMAVHRQLVEVGYHGLCDIMISWLSIGKDIMECFYSRKAAPNYCDLDIKTL